MKTLLFFTLLICFVIFLIPLAITCKTFINDIFDKNVILINKTINFLIKINNDEITTDNINDYINVYNKCLYNKLITIKKNRISLTKDGLNIYNGSVVKTFFQ